MKLTIIIPCYNEDRTISKLIKTILEINFPIEREIIVIDDGSKINQSLFLNSKIQKKEIKFYRLEKNYGKGTSIRFGLKKASGDIFVIQDADFEYEPNDILKLIGPILKNEAQIVYGNRFSKKNLDMSKSHYIGNRLLTKFTNMFYNSNLMDMETGYKVFTDKILNKINIEANNFEFEPEFTSKVLIKGLKIKEIPISYTYRKYNVSKITFFDGIESLLILLKYRFFSESSLYNWIYKSYKYYIKKPLEKLVQRRG